LLASIRANGRVHRVGVLQGLEPHRRPYTRARHRILAKRSPSWSRIHEEQGREA
jgi:hypothetical protein